MAENTKIFTGGGMFTDAYKEFTKPFEGEYFNLRRADVKGLPESDEEIFYNPTESYGGTSEESSVKSFFSAKGDEEEKVQDEIKKLNTQMQSLGLLNSPLHRMKQQRVMRKFQRTMTPIKDTVVEGAKDARTAWYTQQSEALSDLISGYGEPLTPSGDNTTIDTGVSTIIEPGALSWLVGLTRDAFSKDKYVWDYYGKTADQLGRLGRLSNDGQVDILQDTVDKGGPGSQGYTVFKAMHNEGFLKDSYLGSVFPYEMGHLAPNTAVLKEFPTLPTYGDVIGGSDVEQKAKVRSLTYGDLMRRYRGLNPTSGPSNY
ncbi:MAG: hypothetical protein H8D23_27140 [Candidatus Brocadiales bacterium]|nr:hypothetical protein [Candidatus Brocadiales bacterium]